MHRNSFFLRRAFHGCSLLLMSIINPNSNSLARNVTGVIIFAESEPTVTKGSFENRSETKSNTLLNEIIEESSCGLLVCPMSSTERKKDLRVKPFLLTEAHANTIFQEEFNVSKCPQYDIKLEWFDIHSSRNKLLMASRRGEDTKKTPTSLHKTIYLTWLKVNEQIPLGLRELWNWNRTCARDFWALPPGQCRGSQVKTPHTFLITIVNVSCWLLCTSELKQISFGVTFEASEIQSDDPETSERKKETLKYHKILQRSIVPSFCATTLMHEKSRSPTEKENLPGWWTMSYATTHPYLCRKDHCVTLTVDRLSAPGGGQMREDFVPVKDVLQCGSLDIIRISDFFNEIGFKIGILPKIGT